MLKTQFEEKWAKANALEYTTTNRYKWSAKFICKNRGFEVSVKTFHQWFDMIGNVVVIKSGLNQVVMNFTKGVFKVQKSNDEWTLLGTSFVYDISHLSSMLKRSRKTWCKAFLNFMFNVVVSSEEVENGITETRGKNFEGTDC